jgi:puromycin-sensitive aminopeptidase
VTESRYRLPRHVVPHHYDLTIEPDLASATFRGRVGIRVTVLDTTREFVLNALDLELEEVSLSGVRGDSITASVTYEEDTERVHLTPERDVDAGEWTLSIAFKGMLNDQLRGFYRSTFTDTDGNEQTIATTQFEATDARRAFPCWDEPEFKAVFSLTLIVDEELLAVSNTREIDRTIAEDGKAHVRFADTMKMSTYLVAFIVGPLEATSPVDVDGIPLRVIHVPGKGHLTAFALEAGTFFLRWLADYYGIPYPGDKMDFLAIPDFAFGAMENVGAVTFRENAVLVDPQIARQVELERFSSVIAHELAHMWFGDLVTMKWWNGIWLNEAFATFMEMMASDAFRPEWKTWLEFAPARGYALDTDALGSTRPVEFPVDAPSEADEMFDSLTYQKGSALLRMLQQFLGEETFRQGVEDYLRTHQYGNTETHDLWVALEKASGQPVGAIMNSWIFQGGFPEVEISQSPEGDGLLVEQQRFGYLPEAPAGDWHVPLVVRYHDGDRERTTTAIVGAEPEEIRTEGSIRWAIGNAGGNGFYRVRYTPELMDGMTARINELLPLERYALLDDAWAYLKAGRIDSGTYLDLASRYQDETEAAVWGLVSGTLARLHRIAPRESVAAYEGWVRRLIEPMADRLGWEADPAEDDLTRKLRGTLLRALGTTGKQGHTRERARRIVERLIEAPETVDPEIAVAAVYVTADAGTEADYRLFRERYENAADPQEEGRFMYALPEFPQPELTEETFNMVLDGRIRAANGPMVVGKLLAHESNGDRVWDLITANWDRLIELFPPMIAKRAVETMWTRHNRAGDIRTFLSTHEVPNAEKAMAQALDRLEIAERLANRESNRLGDYVRKGRP